MLEIIDKLESRHEQVSFYNNIYSSKDNHWSKELNVKFDTYFLEIIVGNYRSHMSKFLEVGCGDGRFFETSYSELKRLGFSMAAIDYSPNAINIAKGRGVKVEYLCDDYFTWASKQTKKYNVIYSNGTFEHFEDIQNALFLTRNILSDHGFFIISVPNALGYDINRDDQREGFRRLNGGSRQIEWHLKQSTWQDLLVDAGFKPIFFRGPDERIGFNWISFGSLPLQ